MQVNQSLIPLSYGWEHLSLVVLLLFELGFMENLAASGWGSCSLSTLTYGPPLLCAFSPLTLWLLLLFQEMKGKNWKGFETLFAHNSNSGLQVVEILILSISFLGFDLNLLHPVEGCLIHLISFTFLYVHLSKCICCLACFERSLAWSEKYVWNYLACHIVFLGCSTFHVLSQLCK
jgi:hypothetical protein